MCRQLLEALVYLHDEIQWLHGDIKPQNILMQCSPVPADGSAVDYTHVEIKLADFGLAKIMDQQHSSASYMLSNAATQAGVIKGTTWYLSPEALQGACNGYDRNYADDLWSTCLVMLELDTGLTVQQLMTAPGAVKVEEVLTKVSSELLPLLCSVLAVSDFASRCKSAAELLRKFDASIDPLFQWQLFDASAQKFVPVHPAASFALEEAFVANQKHTMLPLQPPLDLNFDIQALLESATALGMQTERQSGTRRSIRRLLKPSVLTSSSGIPVWQELFQGKEWMQCSPALSAKLESSMNNPHAVPNPTKYRRILLQPGSIGSLQLPLAMKSQPYFEAAQPDDIALLSNRVHDSLPEWDITEMLQVVNPSLASKYAANRHHVAAQGNGNCHERLLFHFASPFVMQKIWQEGQGHDPRLSVWAEVGKGAYFSEHVMYGYAYKYQLWPSPTSKFEVRSEPPIGETMEAFATLVCLGQVADVGPGCESCSSPAWNAWKKEYDYQKGPDFPNPKPTRPPAIVLPADADQKQHLLDLMQVKDAPRYDSVTSTEGDLATHPASTNKTPSGQPICSIMHPRLKDRPKEWGRQYIVFKESDSYPMFILKLKKNRASPLDLRQVVASGYSSTLSLKNIGFTALDLKTAGCSAEQLKDAGFSAKELKAAGFSLAALDAANYVFKELTSAGFSEVEVLQVKSHLRSFYLQLTALYT
jgi:serine/threonine protein kinase